MRSTSTKTKRCYGHYHCNCGRQWRSAFTWAKELGTQVMQPTDGQDCRRCSQTVFAYRVDNLRTPDPKKKKERSKDNLRKRHIQELCHRCRDKPLPCSTNYYDYDDDDEDEDDDLQASDWLNENRYQNGSPSSECEDFAYASGSEDSDVKLLKHTFEQHSPTPCVSLLDRRRALHACSSHNRLCKAQKHATQSCVLDLCSTTSDDDSKSPTVATMPSVSALISDPSRDRPLLDISQAQSAVEMCSSPVPQEHSTQLLFRSSQKSRKRFRSEMEATPPPTQEPTTQKQLLFQPSQSSRKRFRSEMEAMTPEMRAKIEGNRQAALRKRAEYLAKQKYKQEEMPLTPDQKQMIEMKRKAALCRRAAYIAKQNQSPCQ